jgi:hypothetical protein
MPPPSAVVFIEVTFTDTYGVGWIRTAEGGLGELNEPPGYLGCS